MPLKILITAGPTLEAIDPVRYISNHSSGKMGYALAIESRKMGHQVFLVSGPVSLKKPEKVTLISVTTAKEMYDTVVNLAPEMDIIIKAAAVADYRVQKAALQKIKKSEPEMQLTLVKNPDVLKKLGKLKKKNQILVGFAAETENCEKNALQKLASKNCDWLVLNDVSKPGIGFNSNQNAVTLYSRWGDKKEWGLASKNLIARKILLAILDRHS